jgi:hypothetical protein
MWDPRHLTTLWAPTASYKNSFTFYRLIQSKVRGRILWTLTIVTLGLTKHKIIDTQNSEIQHTVVTYLKLQHKIFLIEIVRKGDSLLGLSSSFWMKNRTWGLANYHSRTICAAVNGGWIGREVIPFIRCKSNHSSIAVLMSTRRESLLDVDEVWTEVKQIGWIHLVPLRLKRLCTFIPHL